jgi:hypothetical protein
MMNPLQPEENNMKRNINSRHFMKEENKRYYCGNARYKCRKKIMRMNNINTG